MNTAAPSPTPTPTPPRFDLAVTCLDKRCPQKISCARWQPSARGHAGIEPQPTLPPGRVMALPTLRAPHECRCRPCRAWLPLAPRQESAHG